MTSRKEEFRKAARRFGLPRVLAPTIMWEWRFFDCSSSVMVVAVVVVAVVVSDPY